MMQMKFSDDWEENNLLIRELTENWGAEVQIGYGAGNFGSTDWKQTVTQVAIEPGPECETRQIPGQN